ncbi:TetR family transcriptional regulator [Mycobacterium sp. IS-1496]|uniref:TetR/AcrR family transcriptional regulator n=1 Tax=Mycobacterium sp. IS-1496 TaxID=1772284 RepID=UPI0007416DEB|nr:TetR/AcrR family transcriptional regulator [Mycobacterium sp. IS-1496]KUI36923.1 TetR family transcriptional regulator [Mycobacterium sp. IS-1496]
MGVPRGVDAGAVPSAASSRGRRRDPRTRQDILSATRRILARDGYDQVTVDAVAREAGVSRPTVYRRWPSKAHIVFDAAFQANASDDIFGRTGDFAADLSRFLRAVIEFWREPVVYAATLGILAERHRSPELRIRAQQLLDEETQDRFTALIGDGVRQGVVAADMDAESLYDTVIGSTFYAVYVRDLTGPADIEAFVAHLCFLVTRGAADREENRDDPG